MKTYTKFSLAVAGFSAVIAGVYALMNPKVTIEAISVIAGLLLMFSGINTLWFYAAAVRGLPGTGWLLFDGAVSVIAAAVFIFNNRFVAEALPLMFGIWMLICGGDKIIHALHLRKLKRAKGVSEILLGSICAAAGILALASPLIGTFAVSFLIGTCFVVYGIALIIMWNKLRKCENFGK